jgi:hypothetical protein
VARAGISVLYGFAGGAVGAAYAQLIARSLSPVDGVMRELPETPVKRSRLAGVLIGGIGGGAFVAVLAGFMYSDVGHRSAVATMAVQAFLAVGAIGAGLGLLSGL